MKNCCFPELSHWCIKKIEKDAVARQHEDASLTEKKKNMKYASLTQKMQKKKKGRHEKQSTHQYWQLMGPITMHQEDRYSNNCWRGGNSKIPFFKLDYSK